MAIALLCNGGALGAATLSRDGYDVGVLGGPKLLISRPFWRSRCGLMMRRIH